MKLTNFLGLMRFACRYRYKNQISEGNTFQNHGAESRHGRFSVKKGLGNQLTIGKRARFKGTIEFAGNNNKVILGENCYYNGEIVVSGNNQTVWFGDNSTARNVFIFCTENRDVHIGKWCLLSREIEIRTSDAHSVIDRVTRSRVNKPQSIKIGDHVWVGVGAIINKGSIIPSDSIVGAKAFVNRAFDEEGVILTGSPAKIVRRGITWNRKRRNVFTDEQLDHWKD